MADDNGKNAQSEATSPDDTSKPLEMRRRDAAYWIGAIKEQENKYAEWNDSVDRMQKHSYSAQRLRSDSRYREMQIAWANAEVLKPAIYTNPPVPAVVARFKDRKAMARHAAEIMERSIKTSFDIENIHETLLMVRDDLVDCSRGVLWLRLDTNTIGQEVVSYDHVDRRDFVHSPARNWSEVWWVARRVYLDEAEFKDRFGDEYKGKVKFEGKSEPLRDEREGDDKAEVWEIWDRTAGQVYWINLDCEEYLDAAEPPIELTHFFPCPKPAYGTTEFGSLVPIPHFLYIKDQVEEINELTARISSLSESLRLRGFYSAGAEELSQAIERIMTDTDERAVLVPIPATSLMSGQSVKDSIVWLPVEEIAKVISSLIELRKQLIDDVYEITGISDIMRGQSVASETAAAQQLKAQYGSVRIKKMQGEMIRIARDAAAMAGEIMAEEFPMELLLSMSQYQGVPTEAQVRKRIEQVEMQVEKAKSNPQLQQQAQQNPQAAQQIVQQVQQQVDALRRQITAEQVFEMLREQRLRPFLIDIETDSTIMPDEDANKRRVAEFLAALSGALQQLSGMVAARPDTAEFAGEVLKFSVSPFRAGRELDAAIDEMIERMKSQGEQPNPQAQQLQAEMQMKQAELQLRKEELALKQQEMQMRQQAEQAKSQGELMKATGEGRKLTIEEQKLALDERRMEMEDQRARDIADREIDAKLLGYKVELQKAGMSQETDNAKLMVEIERMIAEALHRKQDTDQQVKKDLQGGSE